MSTAIEISQALAAAFTKSEANVKKVQWASLIYPVKHGHKDNLCFINAEEIAIS